MTAVLSERVAVSSAQETRPGVLFAGNMYSAYGFLSVGEELSGRLAASGWPVITVSRRRDRIGKLLDMVSTAWRMRSRYEVAQIDLFSGAAFVWAEAVASTVRSAGRPFILSLHGGDLPAFAARWPRRVRRLLGAAAAVTSPSAFLGEQMRPYRDDIVLIPNGLVLDAFQYRHRDVARPSLVWMRALHNIYNPTLLPRVLARLARDVPAVHAVMGGPDKGDGSLERTMDTADRLGVRERLHYVGRLDKSAVPRFLDRGDIFLNTTNIDNTPVSVMEALASGLCVVSTAVGGLPYLLRDGVDALLVRADDEQAMEAAVRRVLFEPGLASALSHAARARAHGFEWSGILPRWEALLTRVAGGARG